KAEPRPLAADAPPALRVSAINAASEKLLTKLDVWRYRWRTALRAGALAIVVAGAVAFVAQQDGPGPRRDRVNWQPLSEQAIASALAEHKRVFIDVT
ncbi:hypothetical protein AB0083_26785, partial [Klebsiella pneumoniae]